MINPSTYEYFGKRLAIAGENVVTSIGHFLTNVHIGIIKDPGDILKLGEKYHKQVKGTINLWGKNWKAWADEDLTQAYITGIQHTEKELQAIAKDINIRIPNKPISTATPLAGKLPSLTLPLSIPKTITGVFKKYPGHLSVYDVFRRAAYHNLEGTSLQILRVSQDLYRDIAIQAGESMFKEADFFTRRAISQSMLDDFAKRGVQSVIYKNGRRVSIDSYTEMVGRTMSGRAAIQGSLNRYEEYGYDLVRVSSHFRACELCTPWEGKVLSQSGESKKYRSLNDAVMAGLFHPNCAHDINPYFPGISGKLETRVDPAEQRLINEHGYSKAQEITYEAQQRQRQIEKSIRTWKRREMTALDPVEQAKAHRKMLDWQASQREHLRKNTFLPRKYEREGVKGWYEITQGVVAREQSGTFLGSAQLRRQQKIEEQLKALRSRRKPFIEGKEIKIPATEKKLSGASADLRSLVQEMNHVKQVRKVEGMVDDALGTKVKPVNIALDDAKLNALSADGCYTAKTHTVTFHLSDRDVKTMVHEIAHSRETWAHTADYKKYLASTEGPTEFFARELYVKSGLQAIAPSSNTAYNDLVIALRRINREFTLYADNYTFSSELFRVPVEKRIPWILDKVEKSGVTSGSKGFALQNFKEVYGV